jgi:hypothetical protein
MKKKTIWRWWAKALGEKASKCDKESDNIAVIRTFIFITYLITNSFIIAGVVRHWNDVPSTIPKTQEEGLLNTNSNISQNR